MTTAQKIIKYLAIAFAIFLIINIISGILWAIFGVSFIFGLQNWESDTKREYSVITNYEYNDIDTLNREIDTLDIDIKFSNLKIKTAEEFKVEGDSNYIKCRQDNRTIHIEEINHHWFNKNNSGELIIYMPKNLEFDKVKICTGAGKIDIDRIDTRKLSLEIGAGETHIRELNVKDKADIDGGAGKVEVVSSELRNLSLDCGAGKVELEAAITGRSKISAGIGEIDMTLLGNKDDYQITAEKGIGSIKIDGNECSSNITYGMGANKLKVDGGTYTILSDKADSDLSQIRLDDVIIDGHTCSGTTDHMKCKKIEK